MVAKQPAQSDNKSADKFYAIAKRQTSAARSHAPAQPAGAPVAKSRAHPTPVHQGNVDINEELARRERIRNDDAEQDIALKRNTLNRLFWFLTVETALIFVFALMQAIGRPDNFHLDDWSFRIVVSATIAQITGMLFVAVRYLFPSKKE